MPEEIEIDRGLYYLMYIEDIFYIIVLLSDNYDFICK